MSALQLAIDWDVPAQPQTQEPTPIVLLSDGQDEQDREQEQDTWYQDPDLDDPPEIDYANNLPSLVRPYQGLQGAAGHLQTLGRAMCTLPPGLGKTEAAIMACLDPLSDPPYSRPDGPVLIVCPSFLKDLWFDRIVQYLPQASVVMADGTKASRTKALQSTADWYIINYEMLVPRPAKDLDKLARQPSHLLHKYLDPDTNKLKPEVVDFLADLLQNDPARYKTITRSTPYPLPRAKKVIFDESHHLANSASTVSQEAAKLVLPPDIDVYMLTGTPIRREPDDLYAQMHILYPHQDYGRTPDSSVLSFSVYEDFKRNYCVYLPTPYGNKVVGKRSARIQKLMDVVSYYCSYEDAGIYLPPVTHAPQRFTLDDKRADAYKQIALHYAYQDIQMYSAMEVMHALRSCTFSQGKIDQALNLADQFPHILYFTYYIHSAELLAQALAHHTGRPVPCITGDVPMQERLRLVDSKPPVMVATLGTLSEGKDLSYMQAVCFVEEEWVPYKREQAIDRVRRSGNTTPKIMVYYLLARGTIDETIHQVATKRGATAELIVKTALKPYTTRGSS